MAKNVVGFLALNGFEELCAEVLNLKCNPNFKSEFLLNSRNANNSTISVIIYESHGVINSETYDKSHWGNWKSISLPINLQIATINQFGDLWYIFGTTGDVVCVNMSFSVVSSSRDVPTG